MSEAIEIKVSKDSGHYNVYVGSTDGCLYAFKFDIINRRVEKLWDSEDKERLTFHDWIKAITLFDIDGDGNEEIVVGCLDKYVYILDLEGRSKGAFYCGDEPRAIVAFETKEINNKSKSFIITGSEAGGVYCFRYYRDDELDFIINEYGDCRFSESDRKEEREITIQPQIFTQDMIGKVTLEKYFEKLKDILRENDIEKFKNEIRNKIVEFASSLDNDDKTSIESIAQFIRNNQCIPFIGAGLSVEAGAPTAEQLKNEFCDKLNLPHKHFSTLAEAAQYYSFKCGNALDMVRFVQDKIQGSIINRCSIGFTLLKLLNCERFITTNYDNLIEIQFNTNERYVRVVPEEFYIEGMVIEKKYLKFMVILIIINI